MKLSVEIKPLSQNEAWRGRRFKSDKYLTFEEEMLYTLPKLKPLEGLIEVSYTFYFKSKNSDIDNCIKSCQDCLVKAGVIKDDRYIYRLIVEKVISPVEKIEVEILPYVIH